MSFFIYLSFFLIVHSAQSFSSNHFFNDKQDEALLIQRWNNKLKLFNDSERENFIRLHNLQHQKTIDMISCEQCMSTFQIRVRNILFNSQKTPDRDKRTWSELFYFRPAQENVEVKPKPISYKMWLKSGCKKDPSLFDSALLYEGELLDFVTYFGEKMFRIEAQLNWEFVENKQIDQQFAIYDKKKRDYDFFWICVDVHRRIPTYQPPAFEPYIPQNNSTYMRGNADATPAQIKESEYYLKLAIDATRCSAGFGEPTCRVYISSQSSLCSRYDLTKKHCNALIDYIQKGKYFGPCRPFINDC
ncbi:MAG: hypothetical protein KC505_03515 [Myxococcales bacterium]|nr:hypothetical protein [Myxococcales bacterium]USN50329.1 MAG: hypothetical protein H6731_08690 [Myxococcales bacterium]